MGKPRGCILGALAALLPLVITAGGHAVALQLPDLVAFPPQDVHVGPADDPAQGARALRFETWVANLGEYAVDLVGTPRPDVATWDAQQCVGWVSRVCGAEQQVGTFSWNVAHAHWHYDRFASYELRKLGADGRPDESPDGLLGSSDKVSFCLEDTIGVRSSPDYIGFLPLYKVCSGIRQGISAGYADIYTSPLAGQQIPLAGIPDDTYALVNTVNPSHTILETDYSDNSTFVKVKIAGQNATVGDD